MLNLRSHSLRTTLDLGVGLILGAIVVIGLTVHFVVLSFAHQEAETQIRTLSRNRSQTELLQALTTQELGLSSYLATGDRSFLKVWDEGIKLEADAMQAFVRNFPAEDEAEARPQMLRIQEHILAWRTELVKPLLQSRLRGPLPNLRQALGEERAAFEKIREASETLLRFLDARDEHRLLRLERQRQRMRWIASAVVAVLVIGVFGLARVLVRRIALPMAALADAAWYGEGFPEPEPQALREVDILGQALYDLDRRVKDREGALRQEREEALAVQAFTELVQHLTNAQDLLGALAQALERLVKPDQLLILLKADQGDGMEVWGEATEAQGEHRVLKEALACRALHLGSPVELGAQSPTACRCTLGVPGRGSYLCLPLTASGLQLGLVNLQSKQAGYWAGSRRNLAAACVSVAAAALQALRALETAREQAVRDPLTGTYNRRFLDEVLEKFVQQTLRQERTLSVLMFDIDHFKRFNDTFGHEVGDRVLVAFARFVRGHLRTGDTLARYGGEEFLAILPETSHEAALALAERIRGGIQALELAEPEFPKGCAMTVSVGVSTLPVHGRSRERIVNAADKALYCAKGGGRNQVVGADGLGLP